jgi:two-component system, NtrC family, response regulator AtoC
MPISPSQSNGHTVLVAEDEIEVRDYLEMALKCLGYSVVLAQDGHELITCLQADRNAISVVLLDLVMPESDGIGTLTEIRRLAPELPVIVVSGASSTLNVVDAMQSGAADFLCKPVAHDDLQKAIQKSLNGRPVASVVPVPRLVPAKATCTFASRSPRMREMQSRIPQIGWSEAPVLIQGETGSGKEVLARELHANSPRANKPFLKLNCAALPSELVESELFGYERGAFTGAFQKKAGMFELADGGTILLDEIGDMDIRLQAKLLQVLQDQEFQRVGGKEVIKVNVRVLAATHQDLERAIGEKSFREDLYYRLNVLNVHVPALRDRKEDIIGLAEHLLKKHSVPNSPSVSLVPDLQQALTTYHWPGNVRELENTMRRFLVLRDPSIIARELEAKKNRKSNATAATSAAVLLEPETSVPTDSEAPILEQVVRAKHQAETEAILAALNSTQWNRKQAAALLRIDYKAFLYKMKKLGVEKKAAAVSNGSSLAARAATVN